MKIREVLLEATDFLYHYTDLNGFVGIINSGQIKGFVYPISGEKTEASLEKENKKEIATTRNKRINPSLSSGVGPFRFRIETRYVNKKIRNINELVVDAVKFLINNIKKVKNEKQAHNIMIEASKIFGKKPLEKKDNTYRLKKEFWSSNINPKALFTHGPLASLYEDYDKLDKKYFDNDGNKMNRFRLILQIYPSYYSFALGKAEREREERIEANSLKLSDKYVQFEFLKGAFDKIKNEILLDDIPSERKLSKLTKKEAIDIIKKLDSKKVEVIKNEEYRKIKDYLNLK